MRKSYLEVTFRKGKPIAGYLYLPRRPDDISVRTEKFGHGVVVDFTSDGRPIGIELVSLHHVPLDTINQIVSRVDEPANQAELAPLTMIGA